MTELAKNLEHLHKLADNPQLFIIVILIGVVYYQMRTVKWYREQLIKDSKLDREKDEKFLSGMANLQSQLTLQQTEIKTQLDIINTKLDLK